MRGQGDADAESTLAYRWYWNPGPWHSGTMHHRTRRSPPFLTSLLLAMAAITPGCSCGGGGGSGGLPGPSSARSLSERTVGELVTPFDVSRQDLLGPNDHYAMYGMRPKIIAVPETVRTNQNGAEARSVDSHDANSFHM